MTRATINKAENRALRKRYFKGKKIPAKSIQSNPPQFAASSFTGKNQPFREPQTWYNGFPVYQNEPARADTSAEVNKEADVLAVGRSSTESMSLQFKIHPAKTKSRLI
jgi:hypothetical protein